MKRHEAASTRIVPSPLRRSRSVSMALWFVIAGLACLLPSLARASGGGVLPLPPLVSHLAPAGRVTAGFVAGGHNFEVRVRPSPLSVAQGDQRWLLLRDRKGRVVSGQRVPASGGVFRVALPRGVEVWLTFLGETIVDFPLR